MRKPFGDKGDAKYFEFTTFLVFVQCLVNSIFMIIKMAFSPPVKREKTVGMSIYAFTSFCYVAAMFTSNQALIYISYPTQVLAKSCKMIPVMLAGIVFARKSYSFTKYLNMVLISIGISIFFLDSSAKKIHIDHENKNLGVILLIASLIFDALTNGFQEKMNSDKATKPTSDELMYYMNAFATVFLGIGLMVNGELLPAIQFCLEYREALIDISLLAITMCAGQVFIFWAISDFGNLVATLLTTTRKFFTIIFSVFWFGNPVTYGQWIGIALVFVSLFIDSYVSFMDHRAKDKEKAAQKSQ